MKVQRIFLFFLSCMILFSCKKSENTSSQGAIKVVLSSETVNLYVGGSSTLSAVVLPEALGMGVKWASLDEDVAKVSDKGSISAESEGVTYVVATSDDGRVKASCLVNVNPPFHYKVYAVDEEGKQVTSVYGYPGLEVKLIPMTNDISATTHEFFWHNSNPEAADMTADGKLSLNYVSAAEEDYIYYGSTNLTLTTEDGYGCDIPVVSSVSRHFRMGTIDCQMGDVVAVNATASYPFSLLCYAGDDATMSIPADNYTLELSNTEDYTLEKTAAGYSVKTPAEAGAMTDLLLTLEAGKTIELATLRIPKVAEIQASCPYATSSTLAFTWTEGDSAASDISKPYTICLYADAACKEIVRKFEIPAGSDCWGGRQPKFIFGGLAPDTKYYFVATDTSEGAIKESDIIPAKTLDFRIVTLPESVTAPGIILAEDFGELQWDFEYPSTSAGFRPSDKSDFSNWAVDSFAASGASAELTFKGQTTALPKSRLAHWASDSNVYIHAGHLKLGTASGKGWILTPEIPVPEGKVAVVKVTVTSSRHNTSQESKWAIASLTPAQAKVSGYAADFSWPEKVDGAHVATNYQEVTATSVNSWTTNTVEGILVYPGNRIAFGAKDGCASNAARCHISDIIIEVTEIKDIN